LLKLFVDDNDDDDARLQSLTRVGFIYGADWVGLGRVL